MLRHYTDSVSEMGRRAAAYLGTHRRIRGPEQLTVAEPFGLTNFR